LSAVVRSRGGWVAGAPPLALNDDNNPEVINHSAKCFFISAVQLPNVQGQCKCERPHGSDRLLHRDSDLLQKLRLLRQAGVPREGPSGETPGSAYFPPLAGHAHGSGGPDLRCDPEAAVEGRTMQSATIAPLRRLATHLHLVVPGGSRGPALYKGGHSVSLGA
jgi:hypothetical protein